MKFLLTGIDYRTSPVSLRDTVSVAPEKLPLFLASLRELIPYAVILSTCNRTEIYTTESDYISTRKTNYNLLFGLFGKYDEDVTKFSYEMRDLKAVEHLYRVASGLESMVVGEYEILGQVKEALDVAEKANMVNLPLRELFNSAIRTGRKVRTETDISRNALSVSSIAIDFAENILGTLSTKKMIIIGTGEAGKLVARIAIKRGIKNISVSSRTRERADEFARKLQCRSFAISEMEEELKTANILITCAGAPHWIIDHKIIQRVMQHRHRVPLIIIDIAVPRNVQPNVSELKNVYLYNIDDLNRVCNLNREQRENEIHLAENIIKEELAKFYIWWQQFKSRPIITVLMKKAETIRVAQLNQTINKLPPLTDDQKRCLDAMTKSIVTKILTEPISYLKTCKDGEYLNIVKEIFGLDGDSKA